MGHVLAFFVALLPERIKEQEPFDQMRCPVAHVISGLFECLFAPALFFLGYDWFVGTLANGMKQAVTSSGTPVTVTDGEMRGIGVYGYILYLMHPMAHASLYLFMEGFFRAFAAGFAGRCHGIAAFWAIDRIAMFISGKRARSSLQRQLGPDEPDRIHKDKGSGFLVLASREIKDWREKQVAQHEENFYVLDSREFVLRDVYFRYQYTFRPMHPGEIIRGRIAFISSDKAESKYRRDFCGQFESWRNREENDGRRR